MVLDRQLHFAVARGISRPAVCGGILVGRHRTSAGVSEVQVDIARQTELRQRVIEEIDEVADVMVHIDPEDDETAAPNIGLPLRSIILQQLRQAWAGIEGADGIRDDDVTLHYLNGKIQVELVLNLALLAKDPLASRQQITAQFESAARKVTNIKRIQIYFA